MFTAYLLHLRDLLPATEFLHFAQLARAEVGQAVSLRRTVSPPLTGQPVRGTIEVVP
jgi:hypothetical protein